MTPPWWASDLGRIPHVAPVLSLVHWKGIGNPVGILTGTFQPDPVAAMPSMHAAFSMLVGLVLLSLRPRWSWIALLYPLAMSATVLYTGDHYVVDILTGWAFAITAFALVWLRWKARAAPAAPPVAEPEPEPAIAAAD